MAPQTLIEQLLELATTVQVFPATSEMPNLESGLRELTALVQSLLAGLPLEVVQWTGPEPKQNSYHQLFLAIEKPPRVCQPWKLAVGIVPEVR